MQETNAGVQWPSDGLTEVPFRLYTDPEQYRLEQERIFKGPVWNFLCLAAELPRPGDHIVTGIGEVSVVVTRDLEGGLNAFVNRCAHRGSLLCLKRRGNAKEITCVYHSWTYDLKGNLTGVAFERGVKRQGGMPPEFRKEEHSLRRLKVVEFSGLVFGSFRGDAPDIEAYLGPEIATGIRRVLKKPVRILGRNTQVLHNNWKLYVENVKDSYHASLLHLFFTTFRLNRLSQKGGIVVDESGGNHISYSLIDRAAAVGADADYGRETLRSNNEGFRLRDPSLLESADEFGDGVTLQILSVFPGFVLQQIQNAIAVRLVRPRGVGLTDLDWVYLGFEDDDEATTERRLRQNNLVGAAGFISLEDGAVGNFVQRAVRGVEEDAGVIMMGGHGAESQPFRATETSVRGFWKKYRALMGA